MIDPKDPRHGSVAGHAAGCREDCCTLPKLRYDKLRKYERDNGKPRTVPALGTSRRIHALQALGYSLPMIGEHAGISDRSLFNACDEPTVYVSTAEAIAAVYERLSMVVPIGRYTDRSRKAARRKGWAPPLAWDNIDNPNEQPTLEQDYRHNHEVDEAVVIRVLAGESLPTTRAEKDEIVRRWVASGRPEKQLCERLGWKTNRYGKTQAEEVA